MTKEEVYEPLTQSEFDAGSQTWDGVSFVEGEAGDHVFAYGHVDKEKIAAAVTAWEIDLGAIVDEDDAYRPADVEHVYAVTTKPDRDEWYISWAPEHQDHPNRFPVTVISR